MDLTKEVWHIELYRLQKQAPKPVIVKCTRKFDKRPIQYGDEYHGCIDRNETDMILAKCSNGSFLIRDSLRNVGAYTLVIRFDQSNKNYVLYYNISTRQHYVGNKYFENILDLVQDGLIHMYIETRGAEILRRIAENQVYEETPFYRTKMYTLNQERLKHQQQQQQQQQHQKSFVISTGTPQAGNDESKSNGANNNNSGNINRIKLDSQVQRQPQSQLQQSQQQHGNSNNALEDYSGSCDSGIFNSLRSDESGTIDKTCSSRELSPQMSLKTLNDSSMAPEAPPRRKSLYASIRQQQLISRKKLNKTAALTTESSLSSSSSSSNSNNNNTNIGRSVTHYEPIFLSPQQKRISVASTITMTPSSPAASTTISGLLDGPSDFRQLEKPHNFRQHTFVGPQWCDLCAHFMWGLVAQGNQCDDCGLQVHKKCAQKAAADCCPVMKRMRRVYGVDLTGLAKMENRAVPLVLSRLVEALEDRGLANQGIYRISGNIDLIEEVRTELDKDVESVDMQNDQRLREVESLTGLIKLFLRQLPIPLITYELYMKLLSIIKMEKKAAIRDMEMREAMELINSVHYATLKFFMTHLQKVAQLHEQNRMTSSNLAIIFAPTLISKQGDSSNQTPDGAPLMITSPEEMMSLIQTDYKQDCGLIQILIDNCQSIFCEQYFDDDEDDDDVDDDVDVTSNGSSSFVDFQES